MKTIFVLITVLGLLLTACGGVNSGDTSGDNSFVPPSNGSDTGGINSSDGGQQGDLSSQPQTPIINLPGEVSFQDKPRDPGQPEWIKGNAFINSADLVIRESFPIQVGLQIDGDLPTPCNKLTIDIAEPDAENNINIEVYSLVSPAETCIQVLEPFSENITLPTGDLADGSYSVFVNGTLVGEFTYPGG